MNKRRLLVGIVSAIAFSVLGQSASGTGQAHANSPASTSAATAAPIPSERDVASLQTELIQLLRLSPTLTTVVSHDPSLLSDQEYVAKNNPQLAAFLTQHPEVARNPDFYLFSHLKHVDGEPDEALQRELWPDMYRGQDTRGSWDRFWDGFIPLLAFACALVAIVWLSRMFIENRRWSRIFKMQSDVHGKLIEKFTNQQDLAAYMETEAGRKFLEAAPIPVAFEQKQRVPSAVARILTPLQAGIVMVLLGLGLLSLQQAGPDTQTPMRVLGTLVLAPGIGFIISAAVSWLLAWRLGLMPQTGPGGADTPSGASSMFKDRL